MVAMVGCEPHNVENNGPSQRWRPRWKASKKLHEAVTLADSSRVFVNAGRPTPTGMTRSSDTAPQANP